MSALKKKDPQQDLFNQGLLEPAHYLGDSATAHFALLTQVDGATKKRQRCYPVDAMGFVIAECDKSIDTWISQSEFWAPTRRLLHFLRVGLLFTDLDTYKAAPDGPGLSHLSPEVQLERLLRLCESQGVPAPSLVIYSGRGLQAKWLLSAPLPSRALPRWSLVQREIGSRLADMGADFNALDASRVLRLVHTVNSKSGQIVRVLRDTGARYDFDQLADSLLPVSRAELARLRAERALERQEREAAEAVRESKVKAAKRPAVKSRGHLTAIDTAGLGTGLRPFLHGQLAWDRLHDLRKLADLRGWTRKGGAPDGSRDLAVFVGASFLAQAVPNVPRFYDELRVLGKEFCPHWTLSEVHASASAVISRMRMLAKGETVEYEGLQVDPRYRWRNDTLIQRFRITGDEERQLRTIVSETEAKRRAAERERARREAQREASGGLSRAAYEGNAEQRRATARLLRAQGKSWAEVAEAVGYKTAEAARVACR